MRELETRTERVYHEVNGNPGILTPGGRQDQLTTEKQQELMEHFDKFLRADDLTFAIVTDALLGV